MDQVTATTAPAARSVADAEYDHAFRLIARVQRAVADPAYFAAAVDIYREMYSAEMAARFTAAVEEQRRFAAEQDETERDEFEGSAA